jgi:hypothetical protein
MDMLRNFRDHPASVGETYLEHSRHAARFGCQMLRGGVACLVHAVFPWLCTNSGSQIIAKLHDRMVVNRLRHDRARNTLDRVADRS